jgi:hypothetical protein
VSDHVDVFFNEIVFFLLLLFLRSFNRANGPLPPHGHNEIIIREVWANNLEEEFAILRDIIEDFPVVSMVRSQFLRWSSLRISPSDVRYRTFNFRESLLALLVSSNQTRIIITKLKSILPWVAPLFLPPFADPSLQCRFIENHSAWHLSHRSKWEATSEQLLLLAIQLQI